MQNSRNLKTMFNMSGRSSMKTIQFSNRISKSLKRDKLGEDFGAYKTQRRKHKEKVNAIYKRKKDRRKHAVKIARLNAALLKSACNEETHVENNASDKNKDDKPGDKNKDDKPGDKNKDDKPGDKNKDDKPNVKNNVPKMPKIEGYHAKLNRLRKEENDRKTEIMKNLQAKDDLSFGANNQWTIFAEREKHCKEVETLNADYLKDDRLPTDNTKPGDPDHRSKKKKKTSILKDNDLKDLPPNDSTNPDDDDAEMEAAHEEESFECDNEISNLEGDDEVASLKGDDLEDVPPISRADSIFTFKEGERERRDMKAAALREEKVVVLERRDRWYDVLKSKSRWSLPLWKTFQLSQKVDDNQAFANRQARKRRR